MLEKGFITLQRQIVNWRWFKDGNTFRVFLFLLLQANYEDRDFEDITVKRGQIVTSYPALSIAVGISEMQVRTALNHLKKTGEISVKSGRRYSLITINNYSKYQEIGQQSDNSQITNKQQSDNSLITVCQQSDNSNGTKINKDKQINNITKYIEPNGSLSQSSVNKSQKIEKHKYGEYKHVLLTDEQYQKLISDFGVDKTKAYITKVDEYCQQHGKSYKDYNLTIRNFMKRGGETNGYVNSERDNSRASSCGSELV